MQPKPTRKKRQVKNAAKRPDKGFCLADNMHSRMVAEFGMDTGNFNMSFAQGGALHTQGNGGGGIFKGNLHSEGGIKAKITETGQPIEVEDAEAAIVPKAVNSGEAQEFEGQDLTNRQVLSRINQNAGGISFAKGGVTPGTTTTNIVDDNYDRKIKLNAGTVIITRKALLDPTRRDYNGQMMTNREILSQINESGGGASFASGGDTDMPTSFSCPCEKNGASSYKYGGQTYDGYENFINGMEQNSKFESEKAMLYTLISKVSAVPNASSDIKLKIAAYLLMKDHKIASFFYNGVFDKKNTSDIISTTHHYIKLKSQSLTREYIIDFIDDIGNKLFFDDNPRYVGLEVRIPMDTEYEMDKLLSACAIVDIDIIMHHLKPFIYYDTVFDNSNP